MGQQIIDDNGITAFIDDNGVLNFIDDNGNFIGTVSTQYTLPAAIGIYADTGGLNLVNYLNRKHVRLVYTKKL